MSVTRAQYAYTINHKASVYIIPSFEMWNWRKCCEESDRKSLYRTLLSRGKPAGSDMF